MEMVLPTAELANMQASVIWIVSLIQFNKQYSRFTSHNMAPSLAEKIFTNYDSSLLR